MNTANSDRPLPEGFEDLEQFVEQWALAEEQARMHKRWSSSLEEIQRFYDAMVLRVEPALDYLDARNIETLSASENRLLYLTYSLVEVANAVEIYGQPASPHALYSFQFRNPGLYAAAKADYRGGCSLPWEDAPRHG